MLKLQGKFLTAVFLVLAMLGVSMQLSKAQVSTVSIGGVITSAGVSPWMNLSGQSWCWVTVTDSGTSSTLSATVETADNNSQNITTVTSIGTLTGATSPNALAGTLVTAGAPLNKARFNVASFTGGSGTTIFNLSCGPQGTSGTATIVGPVTIGSAPPVVFATPCGNPNTQPCPAKTSNPGGTVLTTDVQPNASPWPTGSPGNARLSQIAGNGGSGGYYQEDFPDVPLAGNPFTWTAKQTATASTTVLLFGGTTTTNMYIYGVWAISAGTTITVLTVTPVTGSGATCGTSTQPWLPQSINITTQLTNVVGAIATIIGSPGPSGGMIGFGLLSKPIVIPATNPATNFCLSYAATTNTSGEYFGVIAHNKTN